MLSAQPAFDKGQIQQSKFRLAMSAGKNRHYRIGEVMGRHFVQSGKAAGLGTVALRHVIESILDKAKDASAKARAGMPDDFADGIHESIVAAIDKRLPHLASALEDIGS